MILISYRRLKKEELLKSRAKTIRKKKRRSKAGKLSFLCVPSKLITNF